MKTKSETSKKVSKSILYVTVLILTVALLCTVSLMLRSMGYLIEKKEPMKEEDIQYLCMKLNIKKEHICNSSESVYPQDFSLYISSNLESASLTYDDIQTVLGEFQTNLVEDQNLNVFVSYYDLNRDSKTDVSIFFAGNLKANILDTILFSEEVGF